MFKNESMNYTEIFKEDKTKRYTGRVRLIYPGGPGNFSLHIFNLTEEDGGTYRCKIKNNSKTIKLIIGKLLSTE